MLVELGYGLAAGLAYGLLGTVLMMLGFVLVDALTPGSLGTLIWSERNRNAALVLASGLVGIGAIVTTAILTSEDGLAAGLASTAGYGLLGLLLMGVSFFVVDLLTPGPLGPILVDEHPHPAAWVTATSHVAVASIVAAAIS